MNRLRTSLWLFIGLCTVSGAALADPVEDYFTALKSIQAEFHQTVIDSAGESVQDSRGQVWMQRPGLFRWDYKTPYRQLIVSDGHKLWTYDEDLEQATVKPIDEALSSTPAVLLSGYRPLSEVMSWAPDSDNDAYRWYRLTPKRDDAAVQSVRIGFTGEQLAIIEVVDGFDNHTRIVFSNVQRNGAVDAALFTLALPAGTDIIGADP